MIRKLTKTFFSSGIHGLGLDSFIGARNGTECMPLIVCYHRVVKDFQDSASRSIAPMLLSVNTFKKHLDWIGSHYDIVSLDEIGSQLEQESPLCKNLAAITFDDGYCDVYKNAFPILRKRNIPATVFAVSNMVGTTTLQVHDELYLLISGAFDQWVQAAKKLDNFLSILKINHKLDCSLQSIGNDPFRITRTLLKSLGVNDIRNIINELKDRVYLQSEVLSEFYSADWDMLREMEQHNVSIGSHTRSHILLPNETTEKVMDEVQGSRKLFREMLNKEVNHFAYPNGSFNRETVNAVASAGYDFAYTTCKHQDPDYPMLTIPRRVFWENASVSSFSDFSPAIMSCQINGIFDPADLCRQNHYI